MWQYAQAKICASTFQITTIMKKRIVFSIFAAIFSIALLSGPNIVNASVLGLFPQDDVTIMAASYADNAGMDAENCMSWGYRTWDFWASGADGVDCACKDREKVWTPCSTD